MLPKRFLRRWQLAAQRRLPLDKLTRHSERRVLRAFHRAAVHVPAYRQILAEAGVHPKQITSLGAFSSLCPVLDKEATFARFSMGEFCRAGALDQLSGVLTSSGSGSRFAFGLTTRTQTKRTADAIDLGLQYAFQVDDRKTLLINCLPMGVRFTSNAVTIAETSVREDMATALIEGFGEHYEQIILVGDPLFMKRLTDFAERRGVDWGQHRVHLILGEETFGENYREFLAGRLGLDLENNRGGMIASSMGVGELGLNLFFETRDTVALRRLAHRDPASFRQLTCFDPEAGPLPMLFVYNPLRTYVEVTDPDQDGYGKLTVSLLEPGAAVPLLRYQTGDVARLPSPGEIANLASRAGIASGLPGSLVMVKGRAADQLADGTHVAQYKDALYADGAIAAELSGAFRVTDEAGGARTVHVQRRADPDATPNDVLQQRLAQLLPGERVRQRVRVFPYSEFPFGMTLDYERKFAYAANSG